MKQPFRIHGKIRLKDFDPDFHDGLDKEQTKAKTIKLCQRIGELQERLHANARHALIILFQGMDASGKDGAVKHVLDSVNPSGVETVNFKGPSAEEKAHDFLWRIHKAVPRYGNIGVFNRSHYEDVLVVRVLKLAPPPVWQKRFAQINHFEEFLAQNNVIVLKFFLHISKDEQAQRLRERLADPSKNWKFSAEDLKMRARWGDFQQAYEDVLNRCSSKVVPWHLVPANRKWYRDYVISKTVVETLEKLRLGWPKPIEDLTKIKIV
jgi:PPK2 family polyphosphate:nucleotide phosphotransferase